jgi:transcriptional regulator of arginine metabolism
MPKTKGSKKKLSEITGKTLVEDLKDLLTEGVVGTQEEVCTKLVEMGHNDVNQSKISRMLRQTIGAVKGYNQHGDIVYRLPKEPAPPSKKATLGSLILRVDHNENSVFIHTSPGAASVVARLLDYCENESRIMGTVAGDDTILVLPKTISDIELVYHEIKQLIWSDQ